MKFREFWAGFRAQHGFTLIEVLAALAISGLIGFGATVATVQVINQSTNNSSYNMASRQAQNAIHWLSRDAQVAQSISGYTGFPLTDDITFSWVEWDHSSHQAVYNITDDDLKRSYSVDGGAPEEFLVANYISSVSENTTFDVFVNSDNVTVATIKVTASVGNGTGAVSVTKEREVIPRTSL